MKGILKIYHPDETLKYNIKSSYCKAVYSNNQHLLEVELTTDDGLDHVEDDSLQYRFPQISFHVYDFPIKNPVLEGASFEIEDSDEDDYTEVDLFDDADAFLYENNLSFDKNEEGILQLTWKGKIDDFYTETEETLPFKLKCHFKEEPEEIDED